MATPPRRAARLLAGLRPVALVALCGVLLLLPLALLLQQPPRRSQVTLIGAGDSLSLLLEGAGGGRALVGGGAGQADLPAALGRHYWPWDRRLDLVIVADRRDLPGAAELVRRGLVRAIATVGLAERRDAAAGLAALRDVCAARGVPLRAIEAAERITIGREPSLALTIAPPEVAEAPPLLRLSLGAFDAPILAGAGTDGRPAVGAILLRANADSYRVAADSGARLIAAPAPPGGLVVAVPEGRYLLLPGAGERATLIADGATLRLRGASLVPLDAATLRR